MKTRKPEGFYEVVVEPYTYNGVEITTATFATKEMAEAFASETGGEVRHRPADAILVDGRLYE
jgi:hypothetical protein